MPDDALTPTAPVDKHPGVPPKPEEAEEAEAWALVETFDSRLTEAEKRIDRVLARLGVE